MESVFHFTGAVAWLFILAVLAAIAISGTSLVRNRQRGSDLASILPFATWPLVILGLLKWHAFGTEVFVHYYSGSTYEGLAMEPSFTSPFGPFFWFQFVALATTQAFWIPKLRRSSRAAWIVGTLNLANGPI